MKKNETTLSFLNCVFITALIIQNIISSKIVAIGPIEFPASLVAYPLTFLMTDVIGEIWGRQEAGRTVRMGILCQLMSLVLIYVAIALPSAPYMDDYEDQYDRVLGSTGRIVLASMVAYVASQTWDVFVFHRLRSGTYGKHKWIRNNASTMTSQAIDTVIFITVAFWGEVPDILILMASQYLVKLLIAQLDTPFFYLLTRGSEDQNPVKPRYRERRTWPIAEAAAAAMKPMRPENLSLDAA